MLFQRGFHHLDTESLIRLVEPFWKQEEAGLTADRHPTKLARSHLQRHPNPCPHIPFEGGQRHVGLSEMVNRASATKYTQEPRTTEAAARRCRWNAKNRPPTDNQQPTTKPPNTDKSPIECCHRATRTHRGRSHQGTWQVPRPVPRQVPTTPHASANRTRRGRSPDRTSKGHRVCPRPDGSWKRVVTKPGRPPHETIPGRHFVGNTQPRRWRAPDRVSNNEVRITKGARRFEDMTTRKAGQNQVSLQQFDQLLP